MFFALLSKTLVFAVCLCISGLKKYWYLQHFLRFCIVPAKDVKTHKYSNLQHFVDFEKLKMSDKCVKTALFADFRYLQNGRGGYALGDAYERPGFRPKITTQRFSVAGLGATSRPAFSDSSAQSLQHSGSAFHISCIQSSRKLFTLAGLTYFHFDLDIHP